MCNGKEWESFNKKTTCLDINIFVEVRSNKIYPLTSSFLFFIFYQPLTPNLNLRLLQNTNT